MNQPSESTNINQEQKEHPEIAEVEWIDECFRVEQKRGGTWESFDKNGKGIVTGLSKEVVVRMTRWHLQCLQDGTLDQHSRVVNDGVVGGKL